MRRIFRLAIILFLSMSLSAPLLLLWGCAGKQDRGLKTIEGDPEPLYKEGLILFNKRNYGEAQKKFEQLKASFPDSPPYSLWAELKIADCHFFKKEYVEAIAAYEEFKKIHPTHEEIPYVQYQIGMSYLNQSLPPDRDQTLTRKALASFEYLLANFPNQFFAEKAKEKVAALRQRLADHEFYVGSYYYKEGRYQAAASRFEGLLERYAKVPGEDRALMLLAKSYLELGQTGKAKEVLGRLVAEYPKSPSAKEAKSMMEKGLPEKKRPPSSAKVSVKEEGEAKVPLERVVLVKYEEEGKKHLSLKEEPRKEKKAPKEPVRFLPMAEEPTKPVHIEKDLQKANRKGEEPRVQEKERKDIPPAIPEGVSQAREPVLPALLPSEESARGVSPQGERSSLISRANLKAEDEERVRALPNKPQASKEKHPMSSSLQAEPRGKFEKAEPIDIASDRVESLAKENRLLFKGNVTARQKDMVIYADDVEALVTEGGKGIERVTATGEVKIQQGLRIASCRKAVFYNAEQKVVLTGDPKVWEGENFVAGEEIIFYVGEDRIEVKGGTGGKGKVRIHPKKGDEKAE